MFVLNFTQAQLFAFLTVYCDWKSRITRISGVVIDILLIHKQNLWRGHWAANARRRVTDTGIVLVNELTFWFWWYAWVEIALCVLNIRHSRLKFGFILSNKLNNSDSDFILILSAYFIIFIHFFLFIIKTFHIFFFNLMRLRALTHFIIRSHNSSCPFYIILSRIIEKN